MKFYPYPFQQVAIDHAVKFLTTAKRGDKQLYAAPTGTGKSIVELCVQQAIPGSWIITPRIEIADGMLDKLGVQGDTLQHRISTPIILRNRLLQGTVDSPTALIFDESHHQEAESWQHLEYLSGMAPAIGYSATPYRGSPTSTRDFLMRWGKPTWLITYAQAAQMNYISIPKFTMLPLIDDDVVAVTNGEFEVESATEAVLDRLDSLIVKFDPPWTRPSIFACPSTRCCTELQRRFAARNLRVDVVTADTPRSERLDAFRRVVQCESALAHINVITEGIDLPLRVLVDLAPVMSPVRWLQQIGRITRPVALGEPLPEVICTNRNLLRHAYLLSGVLPSVLVTEAEGAFGFSERSLAARTIGLEAIGRFRPCTVKSASGATCSFYNVAAVDGITVTEYAALAHPAMEPLWASRRHSINQDGTRNWGTWQKSDPPESLRGFASVPANNLSEKQRAWWNKSAKGRGLDVDQLVDKKNFGILPFLFDCGLKLA